MKNEVRQIKDIDKQIQEKTIDFILKHPDWVISAEVLMGLPDDLCIQYYHRLGENAKTSFFGQYAQQTLFAAKAGDKAPVFSLPDRDGKMVSLAAFKGKYVILDFWGTWCGYCVKDIPRLKASWMKYKDRAAFVSIAFRETEKSWKAALDKCGMDWVNLASPDDKLATIYGIGGYPTKLVLDSDGVIVGKYLGESDDFYKELDRLLGK